MHATTRTGDDWQSKQDRVDQEVKDLDGIDLTGAARQIDSPPAMPVRRDATTEGLKMAGRESSPNHFRCLAS
jgi:hypothetical protein